MSKARLKIKATLTTIAHGRDGSVSVFGPKELKVHMGPRPRQRRRKSA